jgi:protein TonB
MFEQLTDTEQHKAETGARRNFFILSSVGLGAILFAALIISIFAVDLDLSLAELDMVELMAPVDIADQKLPDMQITPKTKSGGSSKPASRVESIARLDESPRETPTVVSTAKNSSKERPSVDKFEIGKFDTDSVGSQGSGRGDGTGDGEGDGIGDGLGTGDETASVAAEDKTAPPPPTVKPVVKEKPTIQTKGVINSLAMSLPKPTLPAAAKMAKAAGTVTVKVLVDEKGNVISADAVSGNELLRASCEVAARSARFTPTLLSGSPIKISGVINYHFNTDGGAE